MLAVDRDLGRPFEHDVEVARGSTARRPSRRRGLAHAPACRRDAAGRGCELGEQRQRPQRRQVGLRRPGQLARDRRLALVACAASAARPARPISRNASTCSTSSGAARVVEHAEPDRVAARAAASRRRARRRFARAPRRAPRWRRSPPRRRRRTAPEADDPERRRAPAARGRRCLDRGSRELGEVERAVDRLAERLEAEVAQRDPDLQRPRTCGSAAARGRRS